MALFGPAPGLVSGNSGVVLDQLLVSCLVTAALHILPLAHLLNAAFVPSQQKNIMAERNVLLKSLDHPFLVGLHYSFQTPEKLYFVLDYVNGGEVWVKGQGSRVSVGALVVVVVVN